MARAAAATAAITLQGPATARPGERPAFRVTVKAPRKRSLAKSKLALWLSRDGRRGGDARLAARSLKSIKAGKSARVRVAARIPATTAPAAYRVLACVKVPKKKEACGRRALVVTGTTGPPAPAGPQATPTPVPGATPGPTAEPTPTPGPQTEIVDTPSPAPGPADAPAADPATKATPLPDESSQSLKDSTDFLYTGDDPIQPGVTAGAIAVSRAAVLRGRVANRLDAPIGGVRVTVAGHPEYGRTATRSDGGFDMAVNGGGPLTLVFEREGYIPAQRHVDVPRQDFVEVDPLVLVPYDTRGTKVDTGGPEIAAVQGSTVQDGDGERTQTLLFDPGTTATMQVNGSPVDLGEDFTVRSTEFTQGDTGKEAMPAQLPVTSGYTYAAEFSVDEAAAAGADEVSFSKPVATYMENFLDLPVGSAIPVGYYDRDRGEWVGSKDGKVIEVVAGGVDTDGDGSADNAGIDDAEKAKLLAMYPAGTQLWRTEITHFSPWDHNFPYGPGPGAGPPGPGDGAPPAPPPKGDCDKEGSIILCDSQVLGEELPLVGTGERLVYRSDRVPGRLVDRTIDIRLHSGTLADSLNAIDLTIQVAGRTQRLSFTRAQALADPIHTFVWDGKDGYGRTVQGAQTVTVDLAHRFQALILGAATSGGPSWAQLSAGATLSPNRARQEYSLTKRTASRVIHFDARGVGLGGWTLSSHHAYDPQSRTLRLGDGGAGSATAQRLGSMRSVPATPAYDGPTALAVAPDGAVWVADTRRQQIRRIGPDGAVSVKAGTGAYGYRAADDGGPATSARLSSPEGLAVVEDGDGEEVLYIADTNANRVRRVGPDGTITTVAGGGSALGDGGPATSARLAGPTGVALSPDGSLIVADSNQHRIRRVGTDGTISTLAGTGTPGAGGDGGPAGAARVSAPAALAHDTEGRLLIADAGNGRVRRVGADGVIETIAGGGNPAGGVGDGLLATAARMLEPTGIAVRPDGEVLIADARANRIRLLTAEGTLQTLAGGGTESRVEGMPGAAATLAAPVGVAVRDGETFFSEPASDRVSRVEAALPGFRDGDLLIASGDGGQVFQFNRDGRHERTLDALTGAVLRRFAYDGQGRLAAVYDDAADAAPAHPALLTVERPAAGQIVLRARHDRATTVALDAAGWIDSVTNPAGEKHELTHAASGLLTGEEDAEGGAHTFVHDPVGRLTSDAGPGGLTQTLAGTAVPGGRQVTLTTGTGRVTTYRTVRDPLGQVVRSTTTPAGAVTVSTARHDGTIHVTYPECTGGACLSEEMRFAPDPRFGAQAPYLSLRKVTLPSGKTRTYTASRASTMRDAARLETWQESINVDGDVTTRAFDARPGDDGGVFTTTTAEGIASTVDFDDHGRVTSSRDDAAATPQVTTYDDAAGGRIAEIARGARSWTYTYDALGRIETRTDGEGGSVAYTRDLADRILTSTVGGETSTFTYDEAGRRLTFETPEGKVSTGTVTGSGEGKTLTLPGTAAYTRGFDADERFATETKPSGDLSTTTYEPTAGRVTGRTEERAGGADVLNASFTHVGATELLGATTWTVGGTTQTVQTTYDGDLPTTTAFSGAAAGSVTHAIGAVGAQVASTTVTAGAGAPRTYAITRDDDRHVVAHGPFTISRNATTGRAETYADAAAVTTVRNLSTAGFGELDERRVTEEADTLYEMAVERDANGRVARREETIAGATTARVYEHDPRGRLVRVADGADATVEAYTYDDDGNRLTADSEDHAVETATYHATTGLQTAAGALALVFDQDGFLTKRGADDFLYAPSGELLSADAGAKTVTYVYDAMGRMTRRTEGAAITSFLYGDPDHALRVTATTDAAGELTTYFYDEEGHLHAFERGAVRYRVGADQAGTPRVVVDADGTIVKRVDRDTWGRVLSDSAPGFPLAIGFAGGIEDPDTGLVRFGARDYDPRTGRFTSRDPAVYRGSPENLFTYAENQPQSRVDPTGLGSVGISGFFGAGGSMTISWDGEGNFGWCSEIGLGLGGSVEVDASGTPENSQSIVAEVSVKAGEGSVSVGAEATDCPQSNTEFKSKGYVKTNAGGIASTEYNTNGEQKTTWGGGGPEVGTEGKLVWKDCLSVKAGFFSW